jgi:hypothetical protein
MGPPAALPINDPIGEVGIAKSGCRLRGADGWLRLGFATVIGQCELELVSVDAVWYFGLARLDPPKGGLFGLQPEDLELPRVFLREECFGWAVRELSVSGTDVDLST